MINQDKWERCLPNDPRRCQNSGIMGQCPYKGVEGTDPPRCVRHNAHNGNEQYRTAAALKAFRFDQYNDRIAGHASNSELKNLRVEIGVCRVLLETIVNQCTTPILTVAHSGKISDLAMKLQKLVTSCHRLDVAMGAMLDRDKVMLIGEKMVNIIAEYISDPIILEKVAERLVDAILQTADLPSMEQMNPNGQF